tara:strand:+ start:1303 stop:1818 length:516 start_codon:yes stop_codon:yes gene_type:complete
MNLQPLTKTNYTRPDGGTYQDSIQNKKDMLEKLQNYERLDDIEDVSLKTHIRYVTLSKETPRKQVFRLGGILEAIHPKYIQLSNGTFKWSVQRYHYNDGDVSETSTVSDEPMFETIFWKYLSKEERLSNESKSLNDTIEALQDQNNDLIDENEQLKLDNQKMTKYIQQNMK